MIFYTEDDIKMMYRVAPKLAARMFPEHSPPLTNRFPPLKSQTAINREAQRGTIRRSLSDMLGVASLVLIVLALYVAF